MHRYVSAKSAGMPVHCVCARALCVCMRVCMCLRFHHSIVYDSIFTCTCNLICTIQSILCLQLGMCTLACNPIYTTGGITSPLYCSASLGVGTIHNAPSNSWYQLCIAVVFHTPVWHLLWQRTTVWSMYKDRWIIQGDPGVHGSPLAPSS